MRSIRELLQLVLKEFKEYTYYGVIYPFDRGYKGLCHTSLLLRTMSVIHVTEHRILKMYISNNAPKDHYYTGNGESCSLPVYNWKPYNKYHRIKWLEKHIKLNESK